jgi:hypothetical protein
MTCGKKDRERDGNNESEETFKLVAELPTHTNKGTVHLCVILT